MKNSIWVAADANGEIWEFSGKKPALNSAKKYTNEDDAVRRDTYNLNLKPLEIVEIIIDTGTQKYEVKRPREIGWYLTERKLNEYAIARYWNGENWCCKPNDRRTYETIHDEQIRVVSEIIRDNEYLKSLE